MFFNAGNRLLKSEMRCTQAHQPNLPPASLVPAATHPELRAFLHRVCVCIATFVCLRKVLLR